MIPEPILTFNNGYHWAIDDRISFKGFFYDRSGGFYHGQKAIQHFSAATQAHQLQEILQHIHGSFSILIKTQEGMLIAVDTMSMFPIFYTCIDNQWLVSDSASILANTRKGISINDQAIAEFRAAGFVLSNETLVKEILRVKPGELLFLPNNNVEGNSNKPQSVIWNYFLPKVVTKKPVAQLEKQLVSVMDQVADRLLQSTNDQTLVVPLSGGYDSRLIACMLKKAGAKKVICFTYGKPNPESTISQKVAEKLGYTWIFSDYTKINTTGYLDDILFKQYCDYAGNLTSMPYLQEYFGVKYLKDNKLIPVNSIFLPGHSGDYLGGSYVEISARTSCGLRDLPIHIADIYFPFLPSKKHDKNQIYNRLKTWFESYTPPGFVLQPGFCPLVEDWDIKEKLAKFIFNSASVFPFFGFDVRFPLWDAPLQSFFRELPYNLRSNKLLYDKTLEDNYFKPMGVFFGKDELNGNKPVTDTFVKTIGSRMGNQVKHWGKEMVPFSIVKNRLKKNDWICYQKFTREMVNDMQQKKHPIPKRFNRYNALICEWYISTLMRTVQNKND